MAFKQTPAAGGVCLQIKRIGEVYYGKNPEFTFDRPLNP